MAAGKLRTGPAAGVTVTVDWRSSSLCNDEGAKEEFPLIVEQICGTAEMSLQQ